MTIRTAIFISGGGSNMVSLAKSMTGDHGACPSLVLSNRADAGGLAKAAEMGIATAVVDHRPFGADRAAFEAALAVPLKDAEIELICLAGFMRVLTAFFIDQWTGRMLNIHPSLLPKYRGLHTHARALEAGDKQAGCSVHEVTPELDDGPLLGQSIVQIAPDETADTLAAKVLVEEHKLYPAVLRQFVSGDKTPIFWG